MINSLFKNSTAIWVRFDNYEWRKTPLGKLYLMPSEDAEFSLYDPLDDVETFVRDTAEAAVTCFHERNNTALIRETIREYVCKYGLLGIMNALPSTAEYMNYDKVFLPKNIVFRDEVVDIAEYIDKFYPFEKPVFKIKNGRPKYPPGIAMPTLKQYGEEYEWLEKVFKDWGVIIICTSTYAQDYLGLNEDQCRILRAGIAAFDGNAPSYHINLEDGAKLEWSFHSLHLAAQMLVTMMLTDPGRPLRLCDYCMKPFIAKNASSKYCSRRCRDLSNKEQ